MVFHTNAKRMIVLWLEDKHLEFLRPKGEKSTSKDYPEEYWSVTVGPVKSLKVGGSDASSSIHSGTVWSTRSPKHERRGSSGPRLVQSPRSLVCPNLWLRARCGRNSHNRASQGLSSDMFDSKICAATTHTPSVGGDREGDDILEPPHLNHRAPNVLVTSRGSRKTGQSEACLYASCALIVAR